MDNHLLKSPPKTATTLKDSPPFPTVPPPSPSISEITPGLLISGHISQPQVAPTHQKHHITSVLSLVGRSQHSWRQKAFRDSIQSGQHLWIQCEDGAGQDLLRSMEECCDFIDRLLPAQPTPTNSSSLENHSTDSCKASVLVHSGKGTSRSATIIIAYLMRKHRKSFKEVFEEVKGKRPGINPIPEFVLQLDVWEKTGYRVWRDKVMAVPKPRYREYLDRRRRYLKDNGLLYQDDFQVIEL